MVFKFEKFSFLIVVVLSMTFIGAFNFPLGPGEAEFLGGHPAPFFMPLNKSVFGSYDFNNGCFGGGVSIFNGTICAEVGLFLNISTLNVTQQNLTILDDLILNGFTQGSVLFVGSNSEISQDNSNLFWDDSNNRLGVGTATPESMFTVADSVAVAPIDDFTKYQILIHSTGINPSRSYGMGTESGAMWFNTDSTFNFYRDGSNLDMTIKDGSVGIGTDSPEDSLHVSGGGILLDNDQSLGGKKTTGATAPIIKVKSDNNVIIGDIGNILGNDLLLTTAGASSGRMIIKNDGKVGIGTSIPEEKLHVVGNISLDGSLIMKSFNLTNISTNSLWFGIPVIRTTNESVNQLLFSIEGQGNTGTIMPHFWLQNGAPGQASGISRSFMIVNELVSLQNNSNITSCQAFADVTGEPLQIDCNSSTTGSDLIVGDDIQVFGDVWIKSTGGFWKFLSRTMQLEDELHENILFNEILTSIIGPNFNLTSLKNKNLTINLDANETTFGFITEEITLNTGTNIVPALNIISYQNALNPTLTIDSSEPLVSHSDVAKLYLGSSTSQVFFFDTDNSHNDKFIDAVYDRFNDDGAIYLSGLNIESSSSDINISTGTVKIRLDEESYVNVVNSSIDFYSINSSGNFEILTEIDSFDVYHTGETISNNKYFNVIWGVVPINQTNMRLVAVMSNKPSVEYNSLTAAEADSFNSVNFFPPDGEIKNAFVPIARTILKKVAGTDTFQLLPDGMFHFDIRGRVTSSSGSPAAPSIVQHNLLDNLDMNVAGHTGNWSNVGFNISISRIILDNGGMVWDNSTCTFISSPDGSTILEVCNA